jgi:hypothetical protein
MMIFKIISLFLFCLLIQDVALSQTPHDTNTKQFMGVQWRHNRSNFFEGWYHRLIDRDKGLSIAVITTAYNIEAETPRGKKDGYVSIIIKRKNQPTIIYQEKIENASLRPLSTDHYEMILPGVGVVTDSSFNLKLEDVYISASWNNRERLPWPRGPVTGLDTPADIAANLPFIPAQWHVHNMGGEASYSIKAPKYKLSVDSSGTFHHEKNWGSRFPTKWYWLDIMDKDQGVFISGAGGGIDILRQSIPAFLLAIRTPVATITVSPQNIFSSYKIETNNCTQFKLTGNDKSISFELSIWDDYANFVTLLIPTTRGYVPGAFENLLAKAKLKLWRSNVFGKKTLIGEYVLDYAAIEFGNEAFKCR